MKCFKHQTREAVAICKACGRGVCSSCALESENGIACRQSCAGTLAEESSLSAQQAAHYRNLRRQNLAGAFFSIGMGILFMFFSSWGSGLVYDFIFLLGAGFAVYGIVVLLANMVIFLQATKNTQP
jgi:hypothetical protein